MNMFFFASNLFTWFLQSLALAAAATAIPLLIRVTPAARLLYWQAALLACLLLPVAAPRARHVVNVYVTNTPLIPAPKSATTAPAIPFTPREAILIFLAAGILVRFVWLFVGSLRLRRYRIDSEPLPSTSRWSEEAQLRIAPGISSPVTFGFFQPVVLLPANFASLEERIAEAILCHEILHVRRRDWLFTVGEEIIRSVLWFMPAIWWILSEIQLAREQTVDAQAVAILQNRGEYVDALLAIATAPLGSRFVPAPLFLRRRHLKRRVMSMLKEQAMSKTRTLCLFAASISMLAGTCWFVTGALPLQAAPQYVTDAPGVSVDLNGAQLMHRTGVAYPKEAQTSGTQGTVVAQVRMDAGGNVVDAAIVSGPDELRRAVLESVLQWHFTRDYASATREVKVTFQAQKPTGALPVVVRTSDDGPLVLRNIVITGLSDAQKTDLLSALAAGGLREGAQANSSAELQMTARRAAVEFDEHVAVSERRLAGNDVTLYFSAPGSLAGAGPNPIRVGTNVAQANLVSQVQPDYPPLAKTARVQGTVVFEAHIGQDGHVQNLRLMSGHPLLVQAAMQAAQQWVYKPTLLNGNPVEVITTIEIAFALDR